MHWILESIFFDTANGYSAGTSEEYLGKALKNHTTRDKVVIASTRWMPWVGLAIGVLVGVFGVRRRRLEYAGALHSTTAWKGWTSL